VTKVPPTTTYQQAIVNGNVPLAQILQEELSHLRFPASEGTVWTTDAPYRETYQQLALHAAAGVSAVEMQAASLFAFATAVSIPVGVVAHVTNAIDHPGQPFDKGAEVEGRFIVEAMCRAGTRYLFRGWKTLRHRRTARLHSSGATAHRAPRWPRQYDSLWLRGGGLGCTRCEGGGRGGA
jgi:phosphorylase superfamily protein